MKYSLVTLALSASASAAIIPQRECSFGLTASGSESGTVGQLSDGQNRIGGGLTPATYSITNGQITDSSGRGCILTPPTTQFQCDTGATPTSGFSIGSSGAVSYSGSTTFYACPASDTEYNIYTVPVSGQTKCVEVSLTASGCYDSGASSSQAVSASSATAKSSKASVSQAVSASSTTTAKSSPIKTSAQSVSVATTSESTSPVASTETAQVQTVTHTEFVQSSCSAAQTVTVTSIVTAPAEKSSQASTNEATSEVSTTKVASQTPATKASTGASTSEASTTKVASQTPATKASTEVSTIKASSTASSAVSTGTSCPTNLSGSYQYPHLIIPVSSSSPNTAYGTQYNGVINSTTSTIFNFDIPTSYTGTCSLVFLFPTQSELETSSFTFSGNGDIDFTQLSTIATQSTTYANQGSVKTNFGDKTVTPGTETVISTFACPAGETVSYELSSVSGTSLDFFQDYNPSPIGLYVTSC